ncbi:hypothetical protein [Frateuria sp. STR12]|uniref:hypothetical protein n=1 Tax=Frateuria hangzhouensis TaxID=2995589 RepID=UPI002260D1A5|nr:hypothetical protein [Frateuria sp. STR12]MCX7514182.1 hypothetical protein [Frateuria sp. STR12]
MQARKQLIVLALALLVVALAGCRHTPDETRVREAIAAAAQAAEQTDAGGVVESLSEDFDGNGGRLERKHLANLIRLARLRGEHVGVTVGPVSIEPRGERLVASFTASLTQGSRLLPDSAGVYQVETAWRREGDEWRCYNATWKRQL